MKKVTNALDNKRSIAGLFLLIGLIYTTYNIQENSSRLKKLTNFESGLQTCFSRVNQSFIANMLDDLSSNYLSQNFQNLTEECFAESVLSAENSYGNQLVATTKKLSNLASNVHWFHEDLLTPENPLVKSEEGRNVDTRFEKIETTKDEILESTQKFKESLSKSLETQKNIFYVSATLLFVLMTLEFMALTRRRLSNSAREKEASAELNTDQGGATSVKVGEIIKTALEQNDLENCAKLFTNFHAYAVLEKGKSKSNSESFVTPQFNTPQKNQNLTRALEDLWEDDRVGVSLDSVAEASMNTSANTGEAVNLSVISSSVVEFLSEKLFSRGVKIDISIPENLTVKGNAEVLEESLYHLFAFGINSIPSSQNEKTISIFAHKLGDVVSFDMISSGVGFEEATLVGKISLDANSTNANLQDLDLTIAHTLMSELNAKMQLDNKISQNGEVIGSRVKVIFRGAEMPAAQGKLVDLKVGSKEEILAMIKA